MLGEGVGDLTAEGAIKTDKFNILTLVIKLGLTTAWFWNGDRRAFIRKCMLVIGTISYLFCYSGFTIPNSGSAKDLVNLIAYGA